jgi:hypothetical protein
LACSLFLTVRHFDERQFFRAVDGAAAYPIEGRILGAAIPHFFPVMGFAANLLETASRHEYETVIVVGPNHSGMGLPIIITDYDWDTPFGMLHTDRDSVQFIAEAMSLAGFINIDLNILEADHSIAVILPFVKYYMPDAEIVTIMLSRGCNMTELSMLAEIIYEISTQKSILLLASVDFSHHININETSLRDSVTDRLIRQNDYKTLKMLDSGYLDSPESMIVLMKYAAFFNNAELTHNDGVIMPESPSTPNIGYSFHVYVYAEID